MKIGALGSRNDLMCATYIELGNEEVEALGKSFLCISVDFCEL